MFFKSCMLSIQFFHGLPRFLFEPLISQCTACLGSVLSSIRRTCPSHLSLLSFVMRSIFSSCVCALTLLLLTLSFHEIPIVLLWNLCAAFSFFCASVRGHNSALYNTVECGHTNDSYSLTLSECGADVCSSIFQIRCWLCRFLFVNLCRNYYHLSIAAQNSCHFDYSIFYLDSCVINLII